MSFRKKENQGFKLKSRWTYHRHAKKCTSALLAKTLPKDPFPLNHSAPDELVKPENGQLVDPVPARLEAIESDSDSESEMDEGHEEVPLKDHLVAWYLTYKVKLNAFTSLLKILTSASADDLCNLPKDARTAAKTPSSVQTKKLTIGEYFHFGIKESILETCSRQPSLLSSLSANCVLNITVNIDSLPLSGSTLCELYPILCKLYFGNFRSKVFCVGLYLGPTKADVQEFLDDFVAEYDNLETTGFILNNIRVFLKIKAIICDAPARSYVKSVKGHTAGNGCDKCYVTGKKGSKMCFCGTSAFSRTDDEFRNKNDPDYHKGASPFEQSSVDMVKDFAIDYMHCILLGIVKKLLRIWLGFNGANIHKLKNKDIRMISALCYELAKTCPSEFSRKPRSLEELSHYKATELRAILLFTGMILFKDFVTEEVYENFLDLMIAMKILLHPTLSQSMNAIAKRLLLKFNKEFQRIYGEDEVVYNVHQATHLADEALHFGNLDDVCSFPFESELYQFKLMKRRPNGALTQLCKRIYEKRVNSNLLNDVERRDRFIGTHCNGPIPTEEDEDFMVEDQFTTYTTKHLRFSVKKRDSYVYETGRKRVGQIVNILQMKQSTEPVAAVRFFMSRTDYFVNPILSSQIGIHQIRNLSTEITYVAISKLKKVWLMKRNDYFVAVELSKTINY